MLRKEDIWYFLLSYWEFILLGLFLPKIWTRPRLLKPIPRTNDLPSDNTEPWGISLPPEDDVIKTHKKAALETIAFEHAEQLVVPHDSFLL